MNEHVYIIAAKRTPIGKFGGSLSKISATTLGSIVIKELLRKNPKVLKHVDEVILGNTLSSGLGQNPARISAVRAGISPHIPSYTINKVCGSSLKAVMLAAQTIQTYNADVIIAGGMENMTSAPYVLDKYQFGVKDSMIYDGLFCSLIGEHMGMTAEYVAKKYKVNRIEQDEYALHSHQKAVEAIDAKKFVDEIVAVGQFNTDEQPRRDTSLQKLKKLKPAFKKTGSVTAGNAAPLNDGAAAVIVASENFVKKNTIKPMAKIIGFASVGLNPRYMGMGAYEAVKSVLKKTKFKSFDIDLWELNEAFASQSVAVIKHLEVDRKKINVNGGALALGHPIAASGARILTTLLNELKRQKKQYGLASLCIGGGQGVAMIVENL